MKLCFIADARSPIALNWISYFIEKGHEVHVISSYPCSTELLLGAKVYQAPIAFARFSRVKHDGSLMLIKKNLPFKSILASLRIGALSGIIFSLRNWLSPPELYFHLKSVRDLIIKISPQIVHAIRIPFEGILAAKAIPSEMPLIISVWGNDFTLFAKNYLLIGWQTKQALQRANAIHCDCQRDLRLAKAWGFESNKLSIVIPGSGGIQTNLFHPKPNNTKLEEQLRLIDCKSVIINPRGLRAYIRNDIFFESIPHILEKYPKCTFLCSGMHGNPVIEKWVKKLSISDNVRLLPIVPHDQMADLFRLSQITVSPSIHDGTPNTLLEAMACGCFPVAGNIESVREWITDGVNGLLCDPTNPESISQAILRALNDAELRQRAVDYNLKLISEKAEYFKVMVQAECFYQQLIEQTLSQKKNS